MQKPLNFNNLFLFAYNQVFLASAIDIGVLLASTQRYCFTTVFSLGKRKAFLFSLYCIFIYPELIQKQPQKKLIIIIMNLL